MYCNFVIISPWKRAGTFILTNVNPLQPILLCAKSVWIGPVVLIFKFFNVFSLFRNFSLWKWTGHFIWTNLNPLHPRMLCAKFGLNWPSGSGEEDFLNFVNVFSLFRNYFPLRKGRSPLFEQTRISSTQGLRSRITYRQMTDHSRSEKLTWAFSSGELKTRRI